jgi:N-acetylglucosamine kinase-like BadF-type ATPase
MTPGFSPSDVTAWGFGLAGVRRPKDVAAVRPYLEPLCYGRPLALDTDAAAAHQGAFNGAPGIILTAGTGAIALGIDDEGERFYSDGWGPVLGDEGSGYWIGLEALRAVCRAADGRGPKTRLTAPVLNALRVPHAAALVHVVHGEGERREQIAQLAPLVLDLAGGEAQTAADIRARAVSHLGETVASVARAMLVRAQERAGYSSPPVVDLPIALRGGLFNDDFFRASTGYSIGERMVELKRDFLPLGAWRIVKPQFDATVGAALLALRHATPDVRRTQP